MSIDKVSIERLEPNISLYGHLEMLVSAHGEYVEFSDYATLQAENEELKASLSVVQISQKILEGTLHALSRKDSEWRDKYMREVEGLNNEGDPIGGDPPSGLRHAVEYLKTENANLKQENQEYINAVGIAHAWSLQLGLSNGELRETNATLLENNKRLNTQVQNLNFDNASLSASVADWKRLYDTVRSENAELERLCDATYVKQGADAYNHCCEVFETWRIKRQKQGLSTHDWTDGLYNSLNWLQHTVDELEQKNEAQVTRIADLEAAVKANHEWHQEHDDCDGYQGSELCTTNTTALAESKDGE